MENVKQVIVVRRDLNMRKGKLAAQVAHAAMKFLIDNNQSKRLDELVVDLTPDEASWISGSFTKVVVGVDTKDELLDLVFKAERLNVEVNEIFDSGKTEFHNVPTLTCAAFGPADENIIDSITGHLKLL